MIQQSWLQNIITVYFFRVLQEHISKLAHFISPDHKDLRIPVVSIIGIYKNIVIIN